MKFYPSPNTRVWQVDDEYFAEWSDRSVDDEDRFSEEQQVFLYASIKGEEKWESRLNTAIQEEFDKWVKETRG